jgi:hypothetical protein
MENVSPKIVLQDNVARGERFELYNQIFHSKYSYFTIIKNFILKRLISENIRYIIDQIYSNKLRVVCNILKGCPVTAINEP